MEQRQRKGTGSRASHHPRLLTLLLAGFIEGAHSGRSRTITISAAPDTRLEACASRRAWAPKPFVFSAAALLRETAAQDGSQLPLCSASLKIPKVAILFIARQGMPLEKLWEAWFAGVGGLVPAEIGHDIVCSHNENTIYTQDATAAAAPCRNLEQGTILQRQYLFSVYVHSSRLEGWTSFDPSSVFHDALLTEHHEAVWGDTTPAVRYMLRTALQDPLNNNFVTLSDSDIPIYPATLVYQQVVHEKKSRVSTCFPYDLVNINRFSCEMEAEGLGMDKWRKSMPWMTLQRDLAQLAGVEEFVYGIFRRHCTGVVMDEKVGVHRGCLTDEHYYGSLFAYYNRSKETDCLGVITHSDFRNSVAVRMVVQRLAKAASLGCFQGHPKSHTAEDISLQLLEELRQPLGWLPKASCAESATGEARKAFIPLSLLHRGFSQHMCNTLKLRGLMGFMEAQCPLFARKFDGGATLPLLALFTNSSLEALRFDAPHQEMAFLNEVELIKRVQN